MFEIYCLIMSGEGLTHEIRTALFKGAKMMVEREWKQFAFQEEGFAAEIQTEFKYAGMGFIYGLVFDANVWLEDEGKTAAKFIVRTKDLEGVNPDSVFWMRYNPELVTHSIYN